MGEISSLFFYIIMFILSTLFIGEYEKKRSKLFLFIGIIIPICVAAFRYNVGTDYNNYIIIFNINKNMALQDFLTLNGEMLFSVIIKIADLLNNAQLMFAISSIITVVIMYKAIKVNNESRSLALVFFLYLFLHFTTSFNIIRQGIAICIIAYSYRYIFDKKLKKFLISVFLASLFHVTALFFLPFYAINSSNKKIRKGVSFIIIVLLIFLILNYNYILNILTQFNGFERYQIYTNNDLGSNREIIVSTIIIIITLLFKKRLENYNEKNKIYIYFLIINWILLLTGFISPFIKRLAMYFGISDIFILAAFPKIFKNKEQRLLTYFLIIFYAITMFILSTYVLKQGNIIPYHTVFEI